MDGRYFEPSLGRGNDFCQKITSKTTGKKPDDLLNEFRNSYNPRIAVTVDMIATGTDVKPLECLLFMRNSVKAHQRRLAGCGQGMPSRLRIFYSAKLEEERWGLGRLRLFELIWNCFLMLTEKRGGRGRKRATRTNTDGSILL